MKVHQLLTETFDNLFIEDTDKRTTIAPQAFDMLDAAYSQIGGLRGSGMTSPQEMIDKLPMWKVYRVGNNVKAVMMYKDKGGRKRVAMATDGTRTGKQMLANMIKAECQGAGRNYAEISGKSLQFHLSILGNDLLDSITIHPNNVADVLGVDPQSIRPVDEQQYQRMIDGQWTTKRMVGNPGHTISR